jgi:hypothetical protein
MNFQLSCLNGMRQGYVATPDTYDVRQRNRNENLNIAIRLLETEFAAPAFIEEPPVAFVFRLIGHLHFDYRTIGPKNFRLGTFFQSPKQKAEIDFVFDEVSARPSLTPFAERHDKGTEFLPGLGEMIRSASNCFSRCDSKVGEASGTPRCNCEKRVAPPPRSRMISAVQRSQNISAALAIGQN